MKPTISQWFTKSVEKRRVMKKELDKAFTLSNEEMTEKICLNAPYEATQRARLLDEGAVCFDDGTVRLFIRKGTIEKFYNSLSDDYVGYINLAHISLESLPLAIGTWTKSDLHIVDLEEGRKGLECDVHLRKDLHIVQDLLAQDMPLSLSVEMQPKFDFDLSEKLEMPIVDEVFIMGFSVVGNPANVTSNDVQLRGEDMDIKLDNIPEEKLENKAEEKVEEKAEEKLEQKEELEETKVEENLEDSEDGMDKLESYINELKEENEQLKNQIQEKDSRIAELEGQLNESNQKVEKLSNTQETFISRIEGLMNTQKQTKEEKPSIVKDGVWNR